MLSGLFLLFTMLLASWLEKRQLHWKALEGQKWWASLGRDVLNGLAVGILFTGFWLRGYWGPDCLVLSVVVSSVLAGVHSFFDRPPIVLVGLVVLWLVFALDGGAVAEGLALMKEALFP